MLTNAQAIRSIGLFNPSNMTTAAWHHSLAMALGQGDSWFLHLCKDVGEKAIGNAVESIAAITYAPTT
jgi:hypothetical protein